MIGDTYFDKLCSFSIISTSRKWALTYSANATLILTLETLQPVFPTLFWAGPLSFTVPLYILALRMQMSLGVVCEFFQNYINILYSDNHVYF